MNIWRTPDAIPNSTTKYYVTVTDGKWCLGIDSDWLLL